ncbi:MAG: glucose-6-phosphate isomerase [Candidatus Pacearchaeota archaeon]|nr:MAG: glucose-6-phosphate isomerase [Candidatus Pacearchaeota archaeon]
MELKEYIKKHYNKKSIIKLRDMQRFFSDKAAVKNKLKQNPLIYTVFRKQEKGTDYSLTILEPGKIGKEHFMTRGHYHLKLYPEIYVLLRGKGLLLIQNKKHFEVIKLEKNKPYYLPAKKQAHRTVNLGKIRLELLTIQLAKAGHSYKKIEKKSFRKKF